MKFVRILWIILVGVSALAQPVIPPANPQRAAVYPAIGETPVVGQCAKWISSTKLGTGLCGGSSTVAWSAITGKPSTFAPSSHTHGDADITALAYSKLTGVPSTFTPSAHTHGDSDIVSVSWSKLFGVPSLTLTTRAIFTGTGLAGGGDLSADRTLTLAINGGVAQACGGTTKVSGLSAAGILTCTTDETTAGGSGITLFNGLNPATQLLAIGSAGTDAGWSSVTATHTLNLPSASAANRGLLTSADWSAFNAKQAAISGAPGSWPSTFAPTAHTHPFTDLTGSATDAQIPNNITIDLAAAATALAANPADCGFTGQFANAIAANGDLTCVVPSAADLTGTLNDARLSSNVPLLNGTNAYTGTQNATGATRTAPAKTGTSLPGTCTIGDQFFKTDATAGQNLHYCTATDTWTQQLNSGGGAGCSALLISAATINPTDSSTLYYAGLPSRAPASVATNARVYFPRAGTVSAVYLTFYVNSTLGTSETSTASFRLNNSTDTTISSAVVMDASFNSVSNTALSIAVAQGDYFEIKLVNPAWATNPAGVFMSGSVCF